MSVECTQNLSRKKISYKFTQFLQGVSIFIYVKFTLTDGYMLRYICAKFELIIRNNKSGIFFGDENVPLLFS